jgi:hypothetical protein
MTEKQGKFSIGKRSNKKILNYVAVKEIATGQAFIFLLPSKYSSLVFCFFFAKNP